jgi:phage replication-related protein YjqB (UPF0714/DUF867 family)
MSKSDKYSNFAELKQAESSRAWRISRRRRNSKALIIAPHGGNIEPGTSDLAACIAGDSYNLYLFEGRKKPGRNQALHITSHHFDEPQALALAAKCSIVLGIHGCSGTRTIYVGGRDAELRADLAAALSITGLRIKSQGHKYRAMEPRNICNRGTRSRGAQGERAEVAEAIRRGHNLSLRQGVLRLLSTLGLNQLKKKWDALYQERSALVHGLVPRPGVDYGDLAFRAMSLAGHILLTDIGREVPSAIRHRDAYYPP